MKKIKNIIGSAVMAVALGCSSMMTSCTDFLTIYPTNSTILENYWKSAEDVNSMLAACYKNMISDATVKRMMIWGELRADNMITRTNASTDFRYIVEANLLETNGYFKWDVFYQTINYCNMLIKYAPDVVNQDPDFMTGDLDIVMGEAYALRALCHFYLVRSFRDIPLSYEALDADEQLQAEYPQVDPLVALDSIMSDLQRAEGLVMRSGGFTGRTTVTTSAQTMKVYDFNNCRITRNAVNAMMADVSLWRAAFTQYNEKSETPSPQAIEYYNDAITYCDEVINAMHASIDEAKEKYNITVNDMGPGTDNPYYLTTNEGVNRNSMISSAYNTIFGSSSGISVGGRQIPTDEVIFKLVFDGSTNANGAVKDFYGYNKTTGSFMVPGKSPIVGDLYKSSDIRRYSFTSYPVSGGGDEKAEYTIAKYATKSSTLNGGTNADCWYGDIACPADWIIYRKTDVMLMKALALASRSEAAEDLAKSFELVQAVNRRSIVEKRDSLLPEEYLTQTSMKELVLNERLRELTYEGKRWYDLVQKALCENSTKNILELVIKKLDSNAGAVQSKMASINSLFCPIHEDELKLNPALTQNPAFEKSSSIERN
jgi:hypothetical protein